MCVCPSDESLVPETPYLAGELEGRQVHLHLKAPPGSQDMHLVKGDHRIAHGCPCVSVLDNLVVEALQGLQGRQVRGVSVSDNTGQADESVCCSNCSFSINLPLLDGLVR